MKRTGLRWFVGLTLASLLLLAGWMARPSSDVPRESAQPTLAPPRAAARAATHPAAHAGALGAVVELHVEAVVAE